MKGTSWKHRKGGVYTVIGTALGQGRNGQGLEGRELVVYQGSDQRLYVRSKSEFLDGRFSLLDPNKI